MSPITATCLRIISAAVILVAVAAPAQAGVIAQSVSGFEGGPGLGADGRVVVGERRGNAALAVLAIDPVTTVVSQLTTFAPVADPAIYSTLDIAGTGGIVTAKRQLHRTPVQFAFAEDASSVLPSVVPLATCTGAPRIGPYLEAAGGDGFVAELRADCGAAPPVVLVRTASTTGTIPLTPVATERTFPGAMFGLRAAGPMVGWIETHYPGGLPSATVIVARAATGQVVLRVPLSNAMFVTWALAPDGSIVFVDGSCAMSVASPAAPVARTFALAPGLCPAIGPVSAPMGFAGGRVVYAASNSAAGGARFAVTDLQGAAHALAATSSGPAGSLPQTALNGATAYVVRIDCDADRLVALDIDATPSVAPASQSTGERCPVRRAGSSRLRVTRRMTVRIALRCPHGCRGTLRLVEQRRGRRERPIGQAPYATPGGTVVVRPRIAGYARARAGCAGGLRVAAIVHPIGAHNGPPTSDLGRGLGTFVIVSKSRCRRAGGPAFTKRQHGPRP